MTVVVLFFEGCPNAEPTIQRLKDVLERLNVGANVNEVEVTRSDDPAAFKFIGSPTVLVDGQDIDPTVRAGATYGFGCRTFNGACVPSIEMIERAMRSALAGELSGGHE